MENDIVGEHIKTIKIEETDPVYERFVNLRNPFQVDFRGKYWGEGDKPENYFDEAKKNGCDGLIVKDIIEGGTSVLEEGYDPQPATDYIVFKPNKIKSIHNIGTFSPKDKDIRLDQS